MVMTANLIPIYGCALLTITLLCLFARQNHKSGWKRQRPDIFAEALQSFYTDSETAREEQVIVREWAPIEAQEMISFSAQMLKLRSALKASSPITQDSPMPERMLVHR